jgi:CP family cyanate transporter-like MFS transporter
MICGLAFIGIILVTLNTRAGITCLSPIYDVIRKSFPITPISQGILGMLPPLGFAFFGWLAPRIISRLGLEKTLLLAMTMVLGGILTRSLSTNILMFGILYAIAVGGMGISNVLLPPIIKRYFPNRIGLLTSLYTATVPFSSAVPSLMAVPVTLSQGWRFSTGIWAGLALIAAIPWLILLKGNRKSIQIGIKQNYPVWRWSIAWAVMFIFSVASISTYSMIAWLPKILTSLSGVSQGTAGGMLAVFLVADFLPCLIVPNILIRTKHPLLVIVFFAACAISAYLGLLYFPAFAWIWVTFLGFGLTLIPISLTLINLRSRTKEGAAELSGFVQGVGYLIAALGPVVIGGIYNLTGGWTVSLWFLIGMELLAMIIGGFAVHQEFIEDSF